MSLKSYLLLIVLILLSGLASSTLAQSSQLAQIGYYNTQENWITFHDYLTLNPKVIASQYKEAFGLGMQDGLVLDKVEHDPIGFTHYRYTMTHKGIPVETGDWLIHSIQGKATSANGFIPKGLDINVRPTISAQQAYQAALDHMGAEQYFWEVSGNEQALKEVNGPDASFRPVPELIIADTDFEVKTESYKLAWLLDVYATKPNSRKLIYIDAQTGEVIKDLEILHTANAVGTAVTKYSGIQTIITDQHNGTYRLRETNRGQGVEIQTLNLQRRTDFNSAVDFTDDDNYWDDTADLEDAATNAHFGAEMTYDYFLNEHQRNSISGQGSMLRCFMNYDTGFFNAFWNGVWMTFGEAGNTPYSTVDVVAHEFAHGVTQFTSNLVYANEPGALNESFSDIFGNAVEHFGDSTISNWLIGEGFGAFRSMSNPTAFGDPGYYKGQNWYEGSFDNGGVHINSGVQNRWFYLLVEGGSGVTETGESYLVQGLGWEKAAKIAYRNLSVYLNRFSQFDDARIGSIQAAEDLYGPCSPEYQATINAWHAVGIGTPVLDEDFSIVGYVPFDNCNLDNAERLTVLVKYNGCDSFPGGQAFMIYSMENPVTVGTDLVNIPPLPAQGVFQHVFTQPLNMSNIAQYRVVSRVQNFADPFTANDSSEFIVTYNKAFVRNTTIDFESRLQSAAILDTVHLTAGERANVEIQSSLGKDRTLGVVMEGGNPFGYSYAPTLSERLDNNPAYASSTCLCINGRNSLDLRVSFDLRQTFSPYYEQTENIDSLLAAPLVNTLQLTVNGNEIRTYVPTSHNQDPWVNHQINLTPYAGGIVNLCFNGMLNQSQSEDNFGIGDRVLIDNINISSFLDPTSNEPGIKEALVEIYPNPSQQVFTVKLPAVGEARSLRVLNPYGQLIQARDFAPQAGETQIDLAGQAAGLYLLEVQTGSQLTTYKLIKQ